MMTHQRINDLHEAIKTSRGGVAAIWEYSASLSQLTVRVTWENSAENMHFICNACTRIEASSTWGIVDFEIQILEDDRFALIDHNAKFFLECGLIRVFRNMPPLLEVAMGAG